MSLSNCSTSRTTRSQALNSRTAMMPTSSPKTILRASLIDPP
jgi:hypothetical protein